MSMTLTDIMSPTRIEEFDAEIDQFNDQMGVLEYSATLEYTRWGEPVIRVYTDQAEPIEEFYDDLDAFREYSGKTQDATSSARAELAFTEMFPGTLAALDSLTIRPTEGVPA